MKQFLFAIFTLSLGLLLTAGTYAQEKEKTENQDTVKQVQKEMKTSSDQIVEDGKPVNTICPVSGEEADPTITYTYNGKTIAMCCNKCLKKFKADPEKYISRLNEDKKPIEKPKRESKN